MGVVSIAVVENFRKIFSAN